jgi:antitoxin (DNA-binding transcriptional repressor) of toxin-antitoxin stability system
VPPSVDELVAPEPGLGPRGQPAGEREALNLPDAPTIGFMGEPGFVVRAEEQPAWAEIVRRAERGESVPVIAHGDHVADIVPSGELDRLRETIEVLSDTELVRDLREGLADARAGRVFSAEEVAADLAARRAAGQ